MGIKVKSCSVLLSFYNVDSQCWSSDDFWQTKSKDKKCHLETEKCAQSSRKKRTNSLPSDTRWGMLMGSTSLSSPLSKLMSVPAASSKTFPLSFNAICPITSSSWSPFNKFYWILHLGRSAPFSPPDIRKLYWRKRAAQLPNHKFIQLRIPNGCTVFLWHFIPSY